MQRIAVIGASGSGKSVLAAELAARLDLAHLELDELFHRPGWEPTPTPEFRVIVAEALATAERERGGWVIAGNYLMVGDIVHGRADTIVWLDLGRRHTIPRVVRRSLRRVVRREQLWNGNRERWRDLLNPKVSIVAEAWRTHPARRAAYDELRDSTLWAGTDVRRLRTPNEVGSFLDELVRTPG